MQEMTFHERMQRMTDADKRAVRVLPRGWFRVEDVERKVGRARYRLNRLYMQGALSRRRDPSVSIDQIAGGHDPYQYRVLGGVDV